MLPELGKATRGITNVKWVDVKDCIQQTIRVHLYNNKRIIVTDIY